MVAVPVDLSAPEGAASLVGRALDEHGRVDVLVNNVGAVRLRELRMACSVCASAQARASRWCWRTRMRRPDKAPVAGVRTLPS